MAEASQASEEQDDTPLVTLKTLQQIEFAPTGKTWVVQENPLKPMLHEDQGEWLQIQAANYGLCNLLSPTRVGPRPTLKASKGLVALLDLRASQSTTAAGSEQLFDTEVSSKKRSRRKKMSIEDGSVHLDLGHHGSLVVKSAKKANEDLHIAFTLENVTTFLKYMYDVGAQSASDSIDRRTYQSTGKYAKG